MADRYYSSKPLARQELFDGRLDRYGIAATSDTMNGLTDGQNTLWLEERSDGSVTAWNDNWHDVARILSAIEECFGVKWELADDDSTAEYD